MASSGAAVRCHAIARDQDTSVRAVRIQLEGSCERYVGAVAPRSDRAASREFEKRRRRPARGATRVRPWVDHHTVFGWSALTFPRQPARAGAGSGAVDAMNSRQLERDVVAFDVIAVPSLLFAHRSRTSEPRARSRTLVRRVSESGRVWSARRWGRRWGGKGDDDAEGQGDPGWRRGCGWSVGYRFGFRRGRCGDGRFRDVRCDVLFRCLTAGAGGGVRSEFRAMGRLDITGSG